MCHFRSNRKRRPLTLLLAAVLLAGLLVASAESLTAYAISEEVQAILNAKDNEEKNALILEQVAKAQAMPVQSNEYTNWPEGPVVDAPAAVLMDIDTGTILYEKNMYDAHYPASITKIMTALLATEYGRRDQEVIFSHGAVYDIEYGSANAGMKEGEKIDLDTCLRVMMSLSANDCAYAAAETVGGGYDNFIAMMNEKAAELGCENSHFANPHGLFDENHYVCAHDMAVIAAEAYKQPWFREICNLTEYKRPITEMNPVDAWAIRNRHQMLHPENEYYYPGITGGKTGFTNEARNTLVTFAERDGMRLVVVVLQTEGVRVYHATKALLDYGFENFCHISTESLIGIDGISQIVSGAGATVPKGTAQNQVFASLALDNSRMPTGVISNQAYAEYQYFGKEVGRDDLLLRPSYAASLVQPLEEETAEPEPEAEPEEKAPLQINPWMAVFGGVFLLALILLLISGISLRRMKTRKKDRRQGGKKQDTDKMAGQKSTKRKPTEQKQTGRENE